LCISDPPVTLIATTWFSGTSDDGFVAVFNRHGKEQSADDPHHHWRPSCARPDAVNSPAVAAAFAFLGIIETAGEPLHGDILHRYLSL
jgi:hypothetical protein